jgi:hypothetical protein
MRHAEDRAAGIPEKGGFSDGITLKIEDFKFNLRSWRAKRESRKAAVGWGTMMRPTERCGRFRWRPAAAAVVDARLIQTRWI